MSVISGTSAWQFLPAPVLHSLCDSQRNFAAALLARVWSLQSGCLSGSALRFRNKYSELLRLRRSLANVRREEVKKAITDVDFIPKPQMVRTGT